MGIQPVRIKALWDVSSGDAASMEKHPATIEHILFPYSNQRWNDRYFTANILFFIPLIKIQAFEYTRTLLAFKCYFIFNLTRNSVVGHLTSRAESIIVETLNQINQDNSRWTLTIRKGVITLPPYLDQSWININYRNTQSSQVS